MNEREVWIRVATMLAAHGNDMADQITKQLSEILDRDNPQQIAHWRRVSAAVDEIVATRAN